MLHLGSAINIMTTPMYVDFQSHILHLAEILVQLADHSLVRPIGLIRDMLLRVNDLTFLLTFM